jgi:hypothetical protein
MEELKVDLKNTDKKKELAIREESLQFQFENRLQEILPYLIDKAKIGSDVDAFKNLSKEKDFFYNFLMSSADVMCKRYGKSCQSVFAGVDYGIIKSYVKKKIILDEEFLGEDTVSLEDLKKMTLKERLSVKKEEELKNLNKNIYDDIKTYISTEIKHKITSGKKFEINQDAFFDQVVIKDVNSIIMNNVISNKKAYVGLLIVSNERMEQLYELLKESKSNLNKV